MDGKSISQHIDSLDQAARDLGVRPLSEFSSVAPEQAADFIKDAGEIELPPLRQFTAQEGLATVTALAAHRVARAGGIAQDLQDCERILSTGAQHGVGWHFEVDF